MPIRAFTTTLLAALLLVASPAADLSAQNRSAPGFPQTVQGAGQEDGVDGTGDQVPSPTFNEFFPEDRSITDCLNNSIPLPNCGSEARGGWAQTTVLVAILAGLAFIAWRIVAASRRARSGLRRTPAATTVPDGGGGAPAP